jgi:hypothetical protein
MSAETVWYLQTLQELCGDYSQAKGVSALLRRFSKSTMDAAMKQAAWIVASAESAAQFLSAILGSDPQASPIATLQSHGYFLRGHPGFFKQMESNYDRTAIQQFLDCLMWVYLDHQRPLKALIAVIGQTKVRTASDAESLLCVWINAVVKRHLALPTISSIGRHFLGYPHFRIVLFNFVRDQELLNVSADHAINASVGLGKAAELSLTPPFPPDEYEQSPLLLMCYLYSCIAGLANVKPPAPPPPVSREDIRVMIGSVADAKRELDVASARVATLNDSIARMTESLKRMKRRSSAIVPPPVVSPSDLSEDDSHTGQPQESRRVTWQLPGKTGDDDTADSPLTVDQP